MFLVSLNTVSMEKGVGTPMGICGYILHPPYTCASTMAQADPMAEQCSLQGALDHDITM